MTTRKTQRIPAIITAVALSSLLALACSGGSNQTESLNGSSASPTISATSVTSSIPASSSSSVSAPLNRLQVEQFVPPFSIDKPADWTVIDLDHPDSLCELIAAPDGRTDIGFISPEGGSASSVIDKLRSTSGAYVVGPPMPATLGNVDATRFDVQLDPSAADTGTGEPPALLGIVGGGQASLFSGNIGRIYVADVSGRPVVVLIEAPAANFDNFAGQAEAALATLQF